MTDYVALALQYGGFTTLDRTYLTQLLADLSEADKKRFITPPPSVINAFFAQYYQKESPQRACQYFFDLSQALDLFQEAPSFSEKKPFVRLNLNNKSYGFAYQNDQEEALVFAEVTEQWTEDLIFQVAQLFPFYQARVDKDYLKLSLWTKEKSQAQKEETSDPLMTSYRFSDGSHLVEGYNQEDVVAYANTFKGKKSYLFQERQALIYIEKEE